MQKSSVQIMVLDDLSNLLRKKNFERVKKYKNPDEKEGEKGKSSLMIRLAKIGKK